MPSIRAYTAERYVIGARTNNGTYKLFQISFGSDSSIYVTFPYFLSAAGQFGKVNLDLGSGYGESVRIGDDFLASAHQVKYSHHPTGQAHFSLSGKVKSTIQKVSVPLHKNDGHVFTVMLQGVPHFQEATSQDKGTKKRGVVTFSLEDRPTDAIKFLGRLHPQRSLARMVQQREPTPWMKVISPDGSIRPGLLLWTPITKDGERYFLMLTAERIPQICAQQEVFLSLIGGLDSPEIALDRKKSTSFLMFIYPSAASYEDLRSFLGTADITSGA